LGTVAAGALCPEAKGTGSKRRNGTIRWSLGTKIS
jgi:hypothetical protein